MAPEYSFTTKLWMYQGKGAWYFLTLPQEYTEEIKLLAANGVKGFSSVKVRATIGSTTWSTSIFPDSKSGSYLLPVKKEIRQTNNLEDGDTMQVKIELQNL